ncbi:hypothetical protein [Thermodesulfovibrio sp. TK110]
MVIESVGDQLKAKKKDMAQFKSLIEKAGLVKQDILNMFRDEYGNHNKVCPKPDIFLEVTEDYKLIFHCKTCKAPSYYYQNVLRKRLVPEPTPVFGKEEEPEPVEEKHSFSEAEHKPSYDEIVSKSKGISLNRKCVVCGADSWIILKPNSRKTSIQCTYCKHTELHIFRKEVRNCQN